MSQLRKKYWKENQQSFTETVTKHNHKPAITQTVTKHNQEQAISHRDSNQAWPRNSNQRQTASTKEN